jgi:hypothetical protein
MQLNLGVYTVEWNALGPVNEQLHSTVDPWFIWVRDQARQSVRLRIEQRNSQ